jgi:hypothetical protein
VSLVQNERLKLLATALNNVAVATFVTALIAPAASFLYGFSGGPVSHLWPWIAGCWFCAGVIVHLAAQRILKGLAP